MEQPVKGDHYFVLEEIMIPQNYAEETDKHFGMDGDTFCKCEVLRVLEIQNDHYK